MRLGERARRRRSCAADADEVRHIFYHMQGFASPPTLAPRVPRRRRHARSRDHDAPRDDEPEPRDPLRRAAPTARRAIFDSCPRKSSATFGRYVRVRRDAQSEEGARARGPRARVRGSRSGVLRLDRRERHLRALRGHRIRRRGHPRRQRDVPRRGGGSPRRSRCARATLSIG